MWAVSALEKCIAAGVSARLLVVLLQSHTCSTHLQGIYQA